MLRKKDAKFFGDLGETMLVVEATLALTFLNHMQICDKCRRRWRAINSCPKGEKIPKAVMNAIERFKPKR